MKLPDVIREEIVRKLKKEGEVNIETVGKFYVTHYAKNASLVPTSSGKMSVRKDKDFMRIGFRPVPMFKKDVRVVHR